MNKVTIKDVAKEAGVAISTASNALNGSNLVNEKTKVQICEVAERMNYIPNLNGRYLKAGKTMMLGFISSNVRGPYFYVLFEAMCRECERLGYGMNLIVTKDKNVIMNNILGHGFDGVFIFEGDRIQDADLDMINNNHVKTILLDRCYSSENISSVVFNSYQSGYELTKYLINLGHKRICFIEGADDVFDSAQRKRGYEDALLSYGIKNKSEYVIKGMFEEAYTYNSVMAMIRFESEILPDAFIAGNDLSAIGCMKALKDLGYIVPDDVSVVGFDDIEVAEYLSPSLTTVRNPMDRQGVQSVELLMRMIHQKEKGHIECLEGELVIRKSSGICGK
jgi:LacI family purine nucleotide synthesis repressor